MNRITSKSNKNQERVKSFCWQCGHETWHDILHEVTQEDDNDGTFWESCRFMTVQCRGCDRISFRTEVATEDNWIQMPDGKYDDALVVGNYPRSKDKVEQIIDFGVPYSIRGIYREAIQCLNHGFLRMAVAGFRAVIEGICKHEKVKGSSLSKKIDALTKEGIISKHDRIRLHAIRFMGNESIHEMLSFREDELIIVADIINGIINNLYVMKRRFENLPIQPVQTYEEFVGMLEMQLNGMQEGDLVSLNDIFKKEKRLLEDDMKSFETQLKEDIERGAFTQLSIGEGGKYRVEQ